MEEQQRRTALVTGAGRGIGRAIALALADAGFDVIVNDLPGSDDLAHTAAAVQQRGRRAVALGLDISDVAAHDGFVDQAWSALGGIDCLVNNAGVSVARRDDILAVTPESFDRLIRINLRGPFFLTQAVAKRMVAVPADHLRTIVTISSANVDFASIDRAEYCLSKAPLAMMSQLYAARLAQHGINTYEVRPGVIRTQMTSVAKDRYDQAFANGLTPIARWGEAEDIGRAVAMLASGALSYSTGETLRVDGGLAVRRL
ncbi:3-ketoacyl-ACP reductase [Methylobacterium nodulans]|uniref:Short-chain dehydrogenase/reductase SDR n=1 Tax=Methylobacterium nodulans (strain LMG 21967 / CNCM I-2342 / ORS 2060) TaxID=460265 RepID=B8IDW0_METNO|nr:3-ketoacyl-ACP reductase [Methylobacterium nodulans]ACL55682.1 short-chain dehydrogenase/reductase SDR [Methylobacterium nodulans ORS 2060]